MSYILEALKKADAERERGHVPDLHAQPLLAALDGDAPPRRARWAVPLLVAGALAIGIGATVWVMRSTRPVTVAAPPPVAAIGTAPAAPSGVASPGTGAPSTVPTEAPKAAPTLTPSPAAGAVGAPPVTSPAPAPPADRTSPSTAEVAPLDARSRATSEAARPPAATRQAEAKRSPPAPRPGAGSAGAQAGPSTTTTPPPVAVATPRRDAPATNAAPAPTAERVPGPQELPDDVRRQLPTFQFGGAVYSDNAANRMLIINGQLYAEGAQPASGVVLERIGLKSAVFRYRGYRYELPY